MSFMYYDRNGLLILGMAIDCSGMASCMMRRKTESARRMVTDSETFSPQSGGSRNTSNPHRVMNTQGRMMLLM